MTETGIGHSTPPVLTTIPIAVIPIIDAGTASLSPFQQTTKIVHDHAGIGVHVRLESAFTMRWNRVHVRPEYATNARIAVWCFRPAQLGDSIQSSTPAGPVVAAGFRRAVQQCQFSTTVDAPLQIT